MELAQHNVPSIGLGNPVATSPLAQPSPIPTLKQASTNVSKPMRSDLFEGVATEKPFVRPSPALRRMPVEKINLTLDLDSKEDLHLDAFSERVLLTHLLKRSDPRHCSQRAREARAKEIAALEKHNLVRLGEAECLKRLEDREGDGTWSAVNMLTSEKYAEKCLDLHFAKFEGRLIHCGDHKFDCYRRDVTAQRKALLQTQGLYLKPVQDAE